MLQNNITTKNLIKFVLPSILIMIFISFYTLVDSIFISRFIGSDALAAVNISLPLYSIAFACGIMFATGGGAVIAVTLGQNRGNKASENFTSLLVIGTIFGIVATIICLLFKNNLISFLGPAESVKQYVMTYSTYLIIAFPFLIIKVVFESILRVDGTPNTALAMTVLGGVLNIILDYIFIVIMDMGIAGAGLGTLLGIVISNFIGFHYFVSKKSKLKFKFAKPDFGFITKTITNGSSEMVNEFSIALMTYIFNKLSFKYMGTDGVAAITIVMGINFIISSVFIGFSMGVAPLISFNYGKGAYDEIQKILRFSRKFITIASISLFIIGLTCAKPLVGIYASKSPEVFSLAVNGLRYFSISFIFVGLNIFASAFFTAFENGKVSALISFVKSFIIFIIVAFLLPLILKTNGIWIITPITELCSVLMVIYVMVKYQKVYNYKLMDVQSDKKSII